jgi:hypothetical protein
MGEEGRRKRGLDREWWEAGRDVWIGLYVIMVSVAKILTASGNNILVI